MMVCLMIMGWRDELKTKNLHVNWDLIHWKLISHSMHTLIVKQMSSSSNLTCLFGKKMSQLLSLLMAEEQGTDKKLAVIGVGR